MSKIIKITKDLLLNILSKNLGFPIENNVVVGNVVRLTARQGLVYAIITSHGYLDASEPDNIFRLTRDNFRVFNQALKFDLQEGVFSTSDLRLASNINSEVTRKPYVGKNDKFILSVEYEKYQEFQEFLKTTMHNLTQKGFNPNDFIIAPIRKSNSGTSELESFFEYVVSVYFNRLKYITDTQIPFFYGIGTPDIAAYGISNIIEKLAKHGFVENGSSIVELMTVSSFGFYKNDTKIKPKTEAIVFEVKTNQIAAPQIKKYTNTEIFNKAYEVIPSNKTPESYAGLITIDPSGSLILHECENPISFSSSSQLEYFNWIETYLKMYVLANLKTDELEELVEKNDSKMNIHDFLDFVKKIDFEKLLISVKQIIEGR